MRIRSLFAAAACALVVPLQATAGPISQDACAGSATVSVWRTLGSDVLENLLFADGGMFVSDGTEGAIVRLDSQTADPKIVIEGASPGGLVEAPDGSIYAGFGNSLVNSFTRNGQAKVVRFDPADPIASLEPVVQGINMANGLTFLPDGDLAVSNDGDYGLLRVDVTSKVVRELAHVWGTNGLTVVGNDLFAAITFDQRSPIARIPLLSTNPTPDHSIQLSYGAVSLEPAVHASAREPGSAPLVGVKGLDDMTRDEAGLLYVVANGTGELLRVDPSTGQACLIAGGLQNPSSVRIAPEDGPYADNDPTTTDFYVTEFSGAIRAVRFTPA